MDITNANYSVTREMQMRFKTLLTEELEAKVTAPVSVMFFGDDLSIRIGEYGDISYRRIYLGFTKRIVEGIRAKDMVAPILKEYKKLILSIFFK